MEIKTNLREICNVAIEKQDENDAFVFFLRTYSAQDIDKIVYDLNEYIAPAVDCTQCGNCCKTLMIQVESQEIDVLSSAMKVTQSQFEKMYIERGNSGIMLINAMPCHFLSENKCSVYEHRFSSCREFPALHLPMFISRLFTTFMHYDRCPIIFNVIEALKK